MSKRGLVKFEILLTRILKSIVTISVLLLLVMVSLQVLSRFIDLGFFVPQDEIIIFLFAWMVFLGSAILVRKEEHLRVELIDLILKQKRVALFYGVFKDLIVCFFLIVMAYSGVILFLNASSRTSPMLQLPQQLWYFPLPFSAFLMLFYEVVLIFKRIRGEKDGSC